MDRKHLAETVSRRDADAEPPRMGSRRVSARCLWFMSVVNNGFGYIHWHRDMNCESPPKTRREPIHGGSNPASMRDTVFGSDSQSMPLILCGTVVGQPPLFFRSPDRRIDAGEISLNYSLVKNAKRCCRSFLRFSFESLRKIPCSATW